MNKTLFIHRNKHIYINSPSPVVPLFLYGWIKAARAMCAKQPPITLWFCKLTNFPGIKMYIQVLERWAGITEL